MTVRPEWSNPQGAKTRNSQVNPTTVPAKIALPEEVRFP